eukprot:350387-Chlamydomonas_euryale.AAC.1
MSRQEQAKQVGVWMHAGVWTQVELEHRQLRELHENRKAAYPKVNARTCSPRLAWDLGVWGVYEAAPRTLAPISRISSIVGSPTARRKPALRIAKPCTNCTRGKRYGFEGAGRCASRQPPRTAALRPPGERNENSGGVQ